MYDIILSLGILSSGVNKKILVKKYSFLFCFFSIVLYCSFFLISTVSANNYQKIAPGDTVTLGEFVFEDDFSPSTTDCTITINNPSNTEVVSSTIMSERADGWHYYDYATAGNASSGIWSAVISCGSALNGDLVKQDKSFIVDETLVTRSYLDTTASNLTTKIESGWSVKLSDFEGATVNTSYKAKLQVLNYATVPTDADSLPTVVITDPAGTVQVPAGVMTKDSNGTYSYSYSIGGSSIGGVWETVVSVVINGETVKVNDYWNLSSSPADVQIIEITDKIIPTITANVRIDNMGTSASDFYYVYCIVSSADNLCGGSDDIDSGSDTAYINAGSFINLSLTLDDVPTVGTYWFKVKARALAEILWAASTEQFVAESGIVPPSEDEDEGGGGGGGGVTVINLTTPTTTPTTTLSSYNGADFNNDGKVNSIDFSILLAFWHKLPPFKNPYVDINKDNKVDSVDFSILLYRWKK